MAGAILAKTGHPINTQATTPIERPSKAKGRITFQAQRQKVHWGGRKHTMQDLAWTVDKRPVRMGPLGMGIPIFRPRKMPQRNTARVKVVVA